jgi:tetratricopeptide (TPR) repeat protein
LDAVYRRPQETSGTKSPDIFKSSAEALAWLDAEQINLVAAVQMATDTGRRPLATRLAALLVEYFNSQHRFDDWITATSGRITEGFHQSSKLQKRDTLLEALQDSQRLDKAINAIQDAVTTFRKSRDQSGEAMALNNLGPALRQAGRFDEAVAALQKATIVYRETGDPL